MPIYEYQCDHCGHTTEALRRMQQADDPATCESCGSEQTHRAHSVCAAHGTESKESQMPELPMGGGCACGDPNGPCAM
jgi:putative FmdB family regulatory protein